MKRRVYVPPPQKVIDDFAQRVCQRLAETRGPEYMKPEVIWGFARFVQLTSEILAKHLTEEANRDDEKLDADSE